MMIAGIAYFGEIRTPISVVYVLDGKDTFIGTISAWFDKGDTENWGRLHWLAIIPSEQGKGLAKPLMTLVLNRLHELGHTKVRLDTAFSRLPAIKLYLKFGFKPEIHGEKEYAAWLEIEKTLGISGICT